MPEGDLTQSATQKDTVERLAEKPSSQRIGRYKLLQKLGEGGMGSVWMAEQTEPVRRQVAIKLIKPGMDSGQVLARFDAERQALALMDHPNIAKVLDAGTTEAEASQSTVAGPSPGAGRPYFVMELVKGIPITQFCDEQRLSIPERLELFLPVCHAIQHAHQKGVIHRDLKPSNVLVALYDGRAVPKVIDFGVAKATAQRLTERTLFTEFGAVIGTLEYMSPEQAEMNQLDIDTRSDIYSLGVMLYELLTGTTPLTREALRHGAFDEVLRRIREEEPPRPSTRLTQSKERLASISAQRKLEPSKLTKLVRGDLDWVVMKALEKDRVRRYETANGLAREIQRHLANEPVMARPPSNLYRFQKLVRRNKLSFAAITAVATALVLGLGLSTWLFLKEKKARQRIAMEATRSQQAFQFLKDMLNGVGPSVAKGRNTELLEEILGKTRERLGQQLTNQPLVQAELQNTIGEIYEALGRYTNAESLHREALLIQRKLLGEENAEVAQSETKLGNVLRLKNDLNEAQVLHAQALATYRKLSSNPDTRVASALSNLGNTLRDQGKFAEAEKNFREALELYRKLHGNDHRFVADTLNNLGNLMGELGKFQEAEASQRQALAIRTKLLPANHPDIAESLNNLGVVLADEGKLVEAERVYRQALEIRQKVFTTEHPMVATTMANLASVLRRQNKSAEAEDLNRQALAIRRKLLRPNHPRIAASLTYLADCLSDQGKFAEAESLHREAVAIMRQQRAGNKHPELGGSLNNLAITLWCEGKLAEAELIEREALGMFKLLGDEYPSVAVCLDNIAGLLHGQGKLAEAEETVNQALAIQRKSQGSPDANLPISLDRLTLLRLDTGKPAEAEAFQNEALALRRKMLAPDDPALADSMTILAGCLLAQEKWTQAETLARDAILIFEKVPPDDWPTFSARSVLGHSLLGQKKFSEAEPLLLASYEAIKQRQEQIPFDSRRRIGEAKARVIRLFQLTGRDAEAAKLGTN